MSLIGVFLAYAVSAAGLSLVSTAGIVAIGFVGLRAWYLIATPALLHVLGARISITLVCAGRNTFTVCIAVVLTP